ncbi:MAG: hypothetical protein U7126_14855 [Microcoleus sp.]
MSFIQHCTMPVGLVYQAIALFLPQINVEERRAIAHLSDFIVPAPEQSIYIILRMGNYQYYYPIIAWSVNQSNITIVRAIAHWGAGLGI